MGLSHEGEKENTVHTRGPTVLLTEPGERVTDAGELPRL